VLAGANTIDAVRARKPDDPSSSIVAALVPQVTHALPGGRGDVLLKGFDTWYVPAMLLALERHGLPARLGSDPLHLLGDTDKRVHRGGPVRVVLRVGADANFDLYLKRSNLELIAYWGTLSMSERAQRLAHIQRLRRPLDEARAAGRLTTKEYLRRVLLLPTIPRPKGNPTSSAVGVFIDHSPSSS
jgi:hypothetical protein